MMNPYIGYGGYNNMMFFGGWMGFIFMILWWVIIIAVLVLILRWVLNLNNKKSHKEEKSPVEILKERYAKGEITREEFEKIKKDIEG